MLIIADENIPYASDVFSKLGEVKLLSGRNMTKDDLLLADALMVRSVTKVNKELLDGTNVKFVATATIGVDHIDQDYLASTGIGFASAAGCNATSVAEYVLAALSSLKITDATLGIIGVGNVGSRLETRAKALGYKVLLNDPPRQRAEGADNFVELDEICERADVISFHVPLNKQGEDATYHLLNEEFIAKTKPGVVLINSSRGAVADTQALKNAVADGRLGAVVLDVWENEPNIDIELGEIVDIATPHIAGYSFDGKVTGTRMIYEAACRHFNLQPDWPTSLPPDDGLELEAKEDDTWQDIVLASYDITSDDAAMRKSFKTDDRGASFDKLRKNYPRRREFANWHVKNITDAALKDSLSKLGYVVE